MHWKEMPEEVKTMDDNKTKRQYGLWESPISPHSLSRGIEFGDVAWDESGTLAWLERRGGRGAIVIQPADGQARRDLNDEFSVGAHILYGGGDFTIGKGHIYFVEANSGRIYRQPLTGGRRASNLGEPRSRELFVGPARAITPAFGKAAAPKLSPEGRWLAFVHTYQDEDCLALVDSQGEHWPAKLVWGQDFYMQPSWHPSGERLAWIAWDHPNMPWDGTYLRTGRLHSQGHGLPTLGEVETIAGDKETSIFQPEFSPDGRYLAYISDDSGWWQLYLYDLESGEHRQLTQVHAEHGWPAWSQGMRAYAFSPDGKRLFVQRNQEGHIRLMHIELQSREEHEITLEGYGELRQVATAPDGQHLALLASAGNIPPRVITCDLSGRVHVWARSTAESLPQEAYAVPQHITWQGMDGEDAHGLYFAPHSSSFEGIGKPPLLVLIHGGPTSQRVAAFYADVQFFTSRGYAVLHVNYRGSTGYGREYRDRLRGKWGIYDVQDAISGARYLVEQGHVDGDKLVIMGGSAGGFTVLKALEDYPGFFKAGVCLYGVSNHFTVVAETHKFESHYWDTLLGPLPEAAELYRERSPIFYTDKIVDPVAIFQGEQDIVVPRAQSDEVAESLRRRGVPHEYHLYPGEGHGFRKPETIAHLYETIERFLKQHVIYS
jgi:dipeptidyl aminopeptidase/acylaminoacyl peptidase